MPYTFLSNEWFGAVKEELEQRPIDLPEKLQDLLVNCVIDTGSGEPTVAVYRGCWFEPGQDEAASATLLTTSDLAYEVMIRKNIPLGVRAISTGKAKIKGDRRKLLALRAVRPSPSQAAFEARIKEMTSL